jgi:hypothetical protein
MHVLILDGGRCGAEPTTRALAALTKALAHAGCTSSTVVLSEQKIAYCLGCFECWIKTPGICRIDDDGRKVTAAMLASDLVVYLTPITFGGYSSTLKKAVDRSICLVSPFFTRIDGEVHHRARYEQYPSLLGVGVLPASDPVQEQMFGRLIVRNALNLHAPTCGSCAVCATETEDVMYTVIASKLATLAPPVVVQPSSYGTELQGVA